MSVTTLLNTQMRTLASLIAWALGALPLGFVLIEEVVAPQQHSDVDSGVAVILYLMVPLGTIIGTVLAAMGMRAKPREAYALLAFLLNVLTLAGLIAWIAVSFLDSPSSSFAF